MGKSRLFLTGAIAVVGGSAHFGFQQCILNPTFGVFAEFLNQSLIANHGYVMNDDSFRVIWAFVIGLNLLGATFGAGILYFLVDKIGRKTGLLCSSTLLLLGLPLLICSKYLNLIHVFCIGRFVCGVGAGLATGFQALYLSEISPIKFRGAVGVLTAFAVEFGSNAANWIGYSPLGSRDLWPIIFAIEMIPSFLLVALLLTGAKESPTYLYSIEKREDAKATVMYYHEPDTDVDSVMKNIEADVKLLKDELTLAQIWADRATRRALVLAVLCNVAAAFSGVSALSYLGTMLLGTVGMSENLSALANAVATLPSLIASFISLTFIDRVGRRKLLLVSLILLAVVDSLLMALGLMHQSSPADWQAWLFMAVLACFMFLFGVGLGPVSWFIGTELAPQNARGAINSAAIGAQYGFGFLLPLAFLPTEGIIGPLCFLLFIIPTIAFAIGFAIWLPETKKRKIGDIVLELKTEIVPKIDW